MAEFAWVVTYLVLLVVPAGALRLCYWAVDYVGDEELAELYLQGEYPPETHSGTHALSDGEYEYDIRRGQLVKSREESDRE